MAHTERVIILVDMDCFYCQVEEKLNPSLRGQPMAVVQYNAWKGGGLIAVNYEARARGVTRHMRGDEAKGKCPEIQLVSVPTVREKADLTRYRDAGKDVAAVLQTFTSMLERASVDEAYLDITESVNDRIASYYSILPEQLPNSHVVGFETVRDYLQEINSDEYLNDGNVKLAVGGVIAEEMRAAVYEKTGYRCSAGVAHNKVLAKLTCGLHKPNQQTILPHESVPTLYENLSVKKIRSMGGKFGDDVVAKLNINTMKELGRYTEKDLQYHFDEKTANWLYNIARGINTEPVTVRLLSKSIGCCKRFPGRGALANEAAVQHWMHQLSCEIAERIEKDVEENNRKPKQLIINYSQRVGRKDVASSRSQSLHSIEQKKIYQESYEIVKKNCQRPDGSYCIKFLGLNVSKFEETKNTMNILAFFKNANNPSCSTVADKKSDEKLEDLNENYEQFSVNESACDNDDSDHSSTELGEINATVEDAKKPTNSFFHTFLNDVNVPKRDFDTSAIFDESHNDLEETQTEEVIHEPITKGPTSNPMPSARQLFTDDNKELCTECSRLIPVEDIQSHMDYHYAIKIVRDEAHLYKSTPLQNTLNTPSPTGKGKKPSKTTNSKKRKPTEIITKFLDRENDIADDENRETCPECNKRIKLEEFASHVDYHVAKKLHQQINRTETMVKPPQQQCNDTKKTNTPLSITNFFKKL